MWVVYRQVFQENVNMTGKNTCGNIGWLLMYQLGRGLLINNDCGIQEGFACVVRTEEELIVQ